MPSALAAMPRQQRATYCNSHWGQLWRKVYTLEFSRWVGWGQGPRAGEGLGLGGLLGRARAGLLREP